MFFFIAGPLLHSTRIMANSKLSLGAILLLVVVLMAPATEAVNRLFVDKITGYHQEMVTAEDIDTDFLIVDEKNVNGGVVASSDDDHTVNTPGSIGLSGTEVDFEAEDSIDITSFGENVRFSADIVELTSRNGDSVYEAVDAIVLSKTEMDISGGSFTTDGLLTEIRSIEDTNFSTDDDLDIYAADETYIVASLNNLSGSSVNFESYDSNIKISAYGVSATAVDSFIAESASLMNIHSYHDSLLSTSTSGDASFTGENAEVRGLSDVLLKSGQTTTITVGENINVVSDRNLNVADGSISINADEAAFLATGTLEASAVSTVGYIATDYVSISDHLTTLSATGVNNIISTDSTSSISLVAVGNLEMESGDTTVFTSTGQTNIYAGDFVNLQTLVNGDINIIPGSSAGVTINSVTVDMEAEGVFNINLDDFIVNADTSSELHAMNSISLTTQGGDISLNSQHYEVYSKIGTEFVSGDNISIKTVTDDIRVFSTRDVIFSGNTITYVAIGEISHTAFEQIYYESSGALTFTMSNDMEFDTHGDIEVDAEGILTINTGDNVRINGDNASIHADGDWIMTADADISYLGSSATVLSATGDASFWSSAGLLRFFSVGNVDFSALTDMSFTSSSDDILLKSSQTLLSTDTHTSVTVLDNLRFSAPSMLTYAETSFSATNDITINADSSARIAADVARDQTLTLSTPTLVLDADDINIQGGAVNLDIANDWDVWADTASFESSNGRSMTWFSDGNILFNVTGDFIARNGFIHTESDQFNIDDSGSSFIARNGELSHQSGGTYYMDGEEIVVTQSDNFGYGKLEADSGFSIHGTSFLDYDAPAITWNILDDITMNADYDFSITSFDSSSTMRIWAPVATYNANEDINLSASEDISVISADNDVNINTSITFESEDDTILYALNSITFSTQSNTVISSPSGVSISGGGAISMHADTDMTFSTNGTTTVGSTPRAVSNLNDNTVWLNAGVDINLDASHVWMYSNGNDEYVDEAITMMAEQGQISFAADTNRFVGDNGVNVTVSVDTSVSGTEGIHFSATNGAILGEGFGVDPDAITFSALPGGVGYTPNDISFVASQAGIFAQTYDDYQATVGLFNVFGGSGVEFLAVEEGSDIDTTVGSGVLSFSAVNLALTAGNPLDLSSRFAVSADVDGTISSGGNIRIHTLADQIPAQANSQVEFTGQSPNGPAQGMVIDVGMGWSGYTAGIQRLETNGGTGTAATITSGNGGLGYIVMGSDAGTYSLNSGTTLNLEATIGDMYIVGGGVDGHVNVIADNFMNITVAENSTARALKDHYVQYGTDLNILTQGDQVFESKQETEGIYVFGGDVSFTSNLPVSSGLDGISGTGHHLHFDGDGEVIFDPNTFFTIGQNNQPLNPVVIANVDSWTADAVGTIQFTNNLDTFELDALNIEWTSSSNALFTSGAGQTFQTTWATGLTGDGTLSISTADGEVSIQGFNAVESVADGSALYTAATTLTMKTAGSSASSLMSFDVENNIQLDANLADMDVVTSTAFTSYQMFLDGADATITSSSGTFLVDSDDEIIARANDDMEVYTDGSNSELHLQTEGENSDMEITAGDVTVAAAGNFELNGDSVYFSSANSVDFSATSSSNGKIQMTASGDIGFAGTQSLTVQSADDIYFDAEGLESEQSFDIFGMMSLTAEDGVLSFENNGGEGGSLQFITTNVQSNTTVNGDSLDLDIDNDVYIDTPGLVFFGTTGTGSSGDFYLSAGGYMDVWAEDFIDFSNSGSGDIIFEANAASLRVINSPTELADADFVIDQDVVVSAAGDIYFTSRGNQTAFNSEDAQVEFSAQDGINIDTYNFYFIAESDIFMENDALGSSSSITEFRSLATNGADYGIKMQTTHHGADVLVTAENLEVQGENIVFNATGTEMGTGFIYIDNDEPTLYSLDYNVFYWWLVYGYSPYYQYWMGAEYHWPSVTQFRGAEELFVASDYGEVRFEYSVGLLIAGNEINGASTGSIEAHHVGNGMYNDFEELFGGFTYGAADHGIKIRDVTTTLFSTAANGEGEIRVNIPSAAINSISTTSTTFQNTDGNMIFSASGSLSIISNRRDDGGAIFFNADNELHLNAKDDDLVVTADNIYFQVLNLEGDLILTTQPGAESSITFDVANSVFLTGTSNDADITFFAEQGSVDIDVTGNFIAFADNQIYVQSAEDIYFEFITTLVMYAENIFLITEAIGGSNAHNPGEEYSTVTFDGRTVMDESGFFHYAPGEAAPDPDTPRPPVYVRDGLVLAPVSADVSLSPGGYCEHDRAFSMEDAFNRYHPVACACVDHTWLCTEVPTPGYTNSHVADSGTQDLTGAPMHWDCGVDETLTFTPISTNGQVTTSSDALVTVTSNLDMGDCFEDLDIDCEGFDFGIIGDCITGNDIMFNDGSGYTDCSPITWTGLIPQADFQDMINDGVVECSVTMDGQSGCGCGTNTLRIAFSWSTEQEAYYDIPPLILYDMHDFDEDGGS